MKVLIYCGVNQGVGLLSMAEKNNWDKIYGFEANPHLCNEVRERCKNDSRIKILNAILSEQHNEDSEFYIIDPNESGKDCSSSVSKNFNPNYAKISGNRMKLKETLRLKTINLYKFLQDEGITEVEELLTDLEGSDLTVLKTLKPLIDSKKIKKIQCEVEPDHMPVKHDGLNNKFSDFEELLKENYELVWKDNVPEHYFAVDCRWQIGGLARSEWTLPK